jgi:hypothetical protein
MLVRALVVLAGFKPAQLRSPPELVLLSPLAGVVRVALPAQQKEATATTAHLLQLRHTVVVAVGLAVAALLLARLAVQAVAAFQAGQLALAQLGRVTRAVLVQAVAVAVVAVVPVRLVEQHQQPRLAAMAATAWRLA